MEEEKKEVGFEIGTEKLKLEEEEEEDKQQEEQDIDDNVLQFLDSVDSYLTLFDSLSSTLRQGWLELASARHSMGALRLNSSLLDLKSHPASTSLQLTKHHEGEPQFILRKWLSLGDCDEQNTNDDLLEKSGTPQLSEEETSPKQASSKADDKVQKERSRSLSVFGTLVSPKLRAAQLSFETALETVVEIANMRSAMLSAFDRVHEELNAPKT
ncbi:conserved hypothetical protein [Ricinus communis]|uniref:Vacuolar ATPase assembly protein VMA22 n=1 Tax=Ricinus communis TaxID=3988 RepID=B9R8Q4_RICCO|nr:conserved hypothetical protein [Ricinus communis]|eukprot:XP_002510697.1 coiled-coil domain-containing protein 115 isoform X1 [Ricinus communis]